MKLITIKYGKRTEEGWADFSKLFNEMDDVIKMDILDDAIYDLELEREKIHKKLYGETK